MLTIRPRGLIINILTYFPLSPVVKTLLKFLATHSNACPFHWHFVHHYRKLKKWGHSDYKFGVNMMGTKIFFVTF